MTLGLAVASAALQSAAGRPPFHLAYVQFAGASFVVGGALSWLARPQWVLGELMMWVAVSLYAEDLYLSSNPVVGTLGLFLTNASMPLLAHLLLAFPAGGSGSRVRRLLLGAAYAVGLVVPALKVPFTEPARWVPHPGRNLLLIHRSDALVDDLTVIYAVLLDTVAVVVLGILAAAYLRATPRLRRILLPAYVPFVLIAVTAFVAYASGGVGDNHVANNALGYVPHFLYPLVPVGFLLGAYASGTSITAVARLAALEGHHDELETTLRATLHDPDLRLLEPDEPIVLRRGRAHRPIVRDGRAVAILDHHADLLAEPKLLSGTASVIGVTVHNRELKELAERQRDEVRLSRLRIVEATHEARRRLERDLHDGTQQRLLAAIIRQRLVEAELRSEGTGTAELSATIDELELTLGELREIGRGIHPALMTERGLLIALRDMVARTPLPIRFVADPLPDLDGIAETALYFAASECVTNAVRHSGATEMAVRVEVDRCHLRVTVVDNGCGGAVLSGSGICGIIDRMAAVGGEAVIDSPVGGGTTVILWVEVGS